MLSEYHLNLNFSSIHLIYGVCRKHSRAFSHIYIGPYRASVIFLSFCGDRLCSHSNFIPVTCILMSAIPMSSLHPDMSHGFCIWYILFRKKPSEFKSNFYEKTSRSRGLSLLKTKSNLWICIAWRRDHWARLCSWVRVAYKSLGSSWPQSMLRIEWDARIY